VTRQAWLVCASLAEMLGVSIDVLLSHVERTDDDTAISDHMWTWLRNIPKMIVGECVYMDGRLITNPGI
jgi:hypothetical protein